MSSLAAGATRDPTRTGRTATFAALALAGLTLAACAGGPRPGVGADGQPTSRYTGYKVGQPYQVRGVWYYPKAQPNYDEIGVASWYGEQFHNHYTADGEVFDMNIPSAAHKTLPLPSLVEVTNLANGRKVLVRVNDRGPFVDGRVIDMSRAGAEALGFVASGLTRVRVRYVSQAPDPPTTLASRDPAPPRPQPAAARRAAAPPPAEVVTPPVSPTTEVAARAPAAEEPAMPAPVALPSTPVPSAPLPPLSSPAPVAAPVLADVDSLLSAAAASPAAVAGAAVGGWQLQAGAFSTESAARGFAAGLTGAGLPEVQPVQRGGRTLYRVIVRGLASPAEAAAARSQAIALGARDPLIVGGS